MTERYWGPTSLERGRVPPVSKSEPCPVFFAMFLRTDALLHAALALSSKERAKLAHGLLRSLDGPADGDADAAWTAEIARRARELDDGSVEAVDWESARERIAQRLPERRP